MAAFPEMPPELRSQFPNAFWNWWQAFRTYLLSWTVVQGDVEITEIGKGVIIKSPDGTRWRITVDNAGAVSVSAV